jgi:hypothetical protein
LHLPNPKLSTMRYLKLLKPSTLPQIMIWNDIKSHHSRYLILREAEAEVLSPMFWRCSKAVAQLPQ